MIDSVWALLYADSFTGSVELERLNVIGGAAIGSWRKSAPLLVDGICVPDGRALQNECAIELEHVRFRMVAAGSTRPDQFWLARGCDPSTQHHIDRFFGSDAGRKSERRSTCFRNHRLYRDRRQRVSWAVSGHESPAIIGCGAFLRLAQSE